MNSVLPRMVVLLLPICVSPSFIGQASAPSHRQVKIFSASPFNPNPPEPPDPPVPPVKETVRHLDRVTPYASAFPPPLRFSHRYQLSPPPNPHLARCSIYKKKCLIEPNPLTLTPSPRSQAVLSDSGVLWLADGNFCYGVGLAGQMYYSDVSLNAPPAFKHLLRSILSTLVSSNERIFHQFEELDLAHVDMFLGNFVEGLSRLQFWINKASIYNRSVLEKFDHKGLFCSSSSFSGSDISAAPCSLWEGTLPPYSLSLKGITFSNSMPEYFVNFFIVLLSCIAVCTGPEDAIEFVLTDFEGEDWLLTSQCKVTKFQKCGFAGTLLSTHSSFSSNSLSSFLENLSTLISSVFMFCCSFQRGWIISCVCCNLEL